MICYSDLLFAWGSDAGYQPWHSWTSTVLCRSSTGEREGTSRNAKSWAADPSLLLCRARQPKQGQRKSVAWLQPAHLAHRAPGHPVSPTAAAVTATGGSEAFAAAAAAAVGAAAMATAATGLAAAAPGKALPQPAGASSFLRLTQGLA
jgi:hypothetical protein